MPRYKDTPGQMLIFEPTPMIPVRLSEWHGFVTEDERERLSQQCWKILWRLRQGPATNVELARIALKYTGRISDLRAAGFNITVKSRNRKSGITTYQLKESNATRTDTDSDQ
jgi:hypothetical protein